jgi:hypothetical protein
MFQGGSWKTGPLRDTFLIQTNMFSALVNKPRRTEIKTEESLVVIPICTSGTQSELGTKYLTMSTSKLNWKKEAVQVLNSCKVNCHTANAIL